MKKWLVPSNDHIFVIADSLKANEGITDWRQTNRFAVGDIVYVYKTKPEQRIRYKMEVIAIDIDDENTLDREVYWKDKSTYYGNLGNVLYCRLRLLVEYDDERLDLKHLKMHGITNNIQSSIILNNETISYIQSVIGYGVDEPYTVDYANDDTELYEGAFMTVTANRYERNREARQKCIDAKGYKCAVCGMDFEKVYGIIGRNYIEVHHIVPISSIGKDYEVDAIKDLVPVCSNCHSMLHQKPGKYEVYTVEELKKKMEEASKGGDTCQQGKDIVLLGTGS